jgi:hypothetical protein
MLMLFEQFFIEDEYSNVPFVCISDLGNAALSGTLVPQLGQLKNLQYLYVVVP